MSDGNNMVRAFAEAFSEVCVRFDAELKQRRKTIIDRVYKGDESAYTRWAQKKFASSGSNATLAEIHWLRAHTTSGPKSVQSDYPG